MGGVYICKKVIGIAMGKEDSQNLNKNKREANLKK
jgi:hypothetical protein